MRKMAIYPGSFDPVTNGHMDIIFRALKIFDRLVVGITDNPAKKHTFSLSDRVRFLKKATKSLSGVKVESFSGLLVDYLKKKEINVVIRGLRAVSDFDYEFQMALTNKRIYPEIETVFLTPEEKNIFLSASTVKEILKLGGDIGDLVPRTIAGDVLSILRKDTEF